MCSIADFALNFTISASLVKNFLKFITQRRREAEEDSDDDFSIIKLCAPAPLRDQIPNIFLTVHQLCFIKEHPCERTGLQKNAIFSNFILCKQSIFSKNSIF